MRNHLTSAAPSNHAHRTTTRYRAGAIVQAALLGLWLCLPLSGIAGQDTTLKFNGSLDYSGPADKLVLGEQIGETWIASQNNPTMCGKAGSTNRIYYTAVIRPLLSPTSLTTNIDGVTYTVFDSGTPGIGWVMGVKDTNANRFTPLQLGLTEFYPVPGTELTARASIGGYVKITLVKTTNHFETGVTELSGADLAQIQCRDNNGAVRDSAVIRMTPQPITIKATGCEVQSANAPVVTLGNFKLNNFPNVGSVAGNQTLNIRLKCDTNIHLAATISDLNNTANLSNTVSLTQEPTAAEGLGVYVYYGTQSTPQDLGPDSSAKGNTHQFPIALTSIQGEEIDVPLRFEYVRTGAMKAGSANALVGVTFSYQ